MLRRLLLVFHHPLVPLFPPALRPLAVPKCPLVLRLLLDPRRPQYPRRLAPQRRTLALLAQAPVLPAQALVLRMRALALAAVLLSQVPLYPSKRQLLQAVFLICLKARPPMALLSSAVQWQVWWSRATSPVRDLLRVFASLPPQPWFARLCFVYLFTQIVRSVATLPKCSLSLRPSRCCRVFPLHVRQPSQALRACRCASQPLVVADTR